MEIQVLTEFQLKMTMIDKDIAKKSILELFNQNVVQNGQIWKNS